MAVRIRLTRVGATKRPAYRVIAIDQRRSRDGRALEILGYYDPLTEPATVQLETDKISAWIGKGAQPSDTVVRLMRQAERAAASPAPAEKPKRASRPRTASKPATKAATTGSAAAPDAAAADSAAPDAAAPSAATPDDATSPSGDGSGATDDATASEPATAEAAPSTERDA